MPAITPFEALALTKDEFFHIYEIEDRITLKLRAETRAIANGEQYAVVHREMGLVPRVIAISVVARFNGKCWSCGWKHVEEGYTEFRLHPNSWAAH